MNELPVSRRTLRWRQLIEIAAYSFLAAVCYVVARFVLEVDLSDGTALAALLVCLASCLVPAIWQLGTLNVAQSDLSILIIMGSRFSILLGAAAFSTATKWQHHNSFCNCLLGYYFPFLLLQSALLIRNQSVSHPPQS